MRTSLPLQTLALAVLLAGFAAGCDLFGSDSSEGGALSVYITDAPFPFDLVQEANVTITGVSLQSETDGAVVLSDASTDLNLLDLREGVVELLAVETEIPAGTYNKIILDVGAASVVLNDDRRFDLTVPSGRIQVLIGNIDLDVDEQVAVLLDFDVSQSFVVRGNPRTPAGINGFNFKPVVRSRGYTTSQDDDDEGADLQGPIQTVGTNYIEIAGLRFHVTDETEFTDVGGLADLTAGMIVEVDYVESGDNVFVARSIDLEGDGEEETEVHETHGTVAEVGADYLVVGESTFAVGPETKLEGFDALAALAVGTEVEVDYIALPEGAGLLALEIEIDD